VKAFPLLASASLAACLASGCLKHDDANPLDAATTDVLHPDAAFDRGPTDVADAGSSNDASGTDAQSSEVRADGGLSADGGPDGSTASGNPLLDKLSSQMMFSSKPTGAATWLVSGDTGAVRGQIGNDMNAAQTSKFPVFTLYHFNMGSGTSASAYHDWVSQVADEISKHSGNAVVVVEPDSFALRNVTGVDDVLDDAVHVLKQKAPNAAVFLDIGNSNWLNPAGVVSRAKAYPHYAEIDGWASNTSNFQAEANEEAFAQNLYSASHKPTIIDSSRNGLGKTPSTIINPPANEWQPGPKFAFHPDNPAVFFNYYNKPSNERD